MWKKIKRTYSYSIEQQRSYKDGKCTVCGAADPNANSGGNTGNNGTDSPNTADEAAMGLWLSLMTVAALAGAVLVLGKRYRA